jgi:hypothetical protein
MPDPGESLRRKRQAAAAAWGPRITRELPSLGLTRARLEFVVEPAAGDRPGPWGIDEVELRFTANPGEPGRPLQRIASGGELSRVMLALKVALDALDRVDLLIFDEVDSGIGGAVAQAVGERLRRLARRRQIVCVTHLPMMTLAERHSVSPSTRRGRTWCGSDTGCEDRATAARMPAGDRVLKPRGGGPRTAGRESPSALRPDDRPHPPEFETLARGGRLVPVYREIFADMDTPVSAFLKVDGGPYSFLLESVEGGEKWGRFSLLGSRPSMIFTARGDRCELLENGNVRALPGHPVAELARLLREHQAVALPGLPRFCGGAVGYLGYDAVRWFEKVPSRSRDDLNLPDAIFMFGDVVSVFDNLSHTLKVVTHARGGSDPAGAYAAAVARIDAEVERLQGDHPRRTLAPGGALPEPHSTATRDQYRRNVDTAREHIRAGDIFQAVLSHRMSVPVRHSGVRGYRALRVTNPSPYLYCLRSATWRWWARPPRCWCGVPTAWSKGVRSPAPAAAADRRKIARWKKSCAPTRRSAPSTSCWCIWGATTSAVSPSTAPSRPTNT